MKISHLFGNGFAAQLDEVVRPLLRTKVGLGLFAHSTPDKMIWEKLPQYDTTESRALARKVEVEGAALLWNDTHILTLNKDHKTIPVIGPNSDLGQTCDYSPKPSPNQLVTALHPWPRFRCQSTSPGGDLINFQGIAGTSYLLERVDAPVAKIQFSVVNGGPAHGESILAVYKSDWTKKVRWNEQLEDAARNSGRNV
jgi:beta-glucosidase-like glycosyl hydrolase